jgi:hypothetical protein
LKKKRNNADEPSHHPHHQNHHHHHPHHSQNVSTVENEEISSDNDANTNKSKKPQANSSNANKKASEKVILSDRIFNECKNIMRPVKRALKNIDIKESSLSEKDPLERIKKHLLEIGDVINDYLSTYSDPDKIKEWRSYLWIFVSKFTTWNSERLKNLYKKFANSREEEELNKSENYKNNYNDNKSPYIKSSYNQGGNHSKYYDSKKSVDSYDESKRYSFGKKDHEYSTPNSDRRSNSSFRKSFSSYSSESYGKFDNRNEMSKAYMRYNYRDNEMSSPFIANSFSEEYYGKNQAPAHQLAYTHGHPHNHSHGYHDHSSSSNRNTHHNKYHQAQSQQQVPSMHKKMDFAYSNSSSKSNMQSSTSKLPSGPHSFSSYHLSNYSEDAQQ